MSQILEYLKQHPKGRTMAEIAKDLGTVHTDRMLKELRLDGCIRMVRRTNGHYWLADDTFRCKDCSRGYPDVRRQGQANSCVRCTTAEITAQNRAKAKGSIDDAAGIDTSFGGSLSASLLSQPLIGVPIDITRKAPTAIRRRNRPTPDTGSTDESSCGGTAGVSGVGEDARGNGVRSTGTAAARA